MKVYRSWLQKFFEKELPSTQELADALTFHVWEIEDVEGETFEVNVLPDRACYGLSHRGVASELSAILEMPMKQDPLQETLPEFPTTDKLTVDIDEKYVLRHTGALVHGVKVGPSPDWLRDALEAVDQRSINNIVDASNYVMLNMGQPTHAFDIGKIEKDGGVVRIDIREAKKGEKLLALDEIEYELEEEMYVIADKTSGRALDIAGVKGGMESGVNESTTDLFVSVGNYDGTLLRRMAQSLKLFTDASLRFQNRPSPELTMYGMRDLLTLIQEVAGGEVVGVVDIYPKEQKSQDVSVTLTYINGLLGSDFNADEVEDVFKRLKFSYTRNEEEFVVNPPFERRDITIPEDLCEEVGRILGYDRLEPQPLPQVDHTPDQRKYNGIERIKDFLVEKGFTEISTQSFAKDGQVELAKPFDATRPFLRSGLQENMHDALKRARRSAPVTVGVGNEVRLFEIGTVFHKDKEFLQLALGHYGRDKELLKNTWDALEELFGADVTGMRGSDVSILDLFDVDLERIGDSYTPQQYSLGMFTPFSQYPFVLRDIAVWVPDNCKSQDVERLIRDKATDLLVRADMFDEFKKDGRISYAFHLVFQSYERTLSDEDVNKIMADILAILEAQEGFEVR